MADPIIIGDFTKCPICGATEKLSTQVAADQKKTGKIPQDAFTAIKTDVNNLENPLTAIVYVKSLVQYHDICGKCGMYYISRVAIADMPKEMFLGPMPAPGRKSPFNI
jgi:hypothetical protein